MIALVTFMFCAVLMAWHSFGDLPGTVGIAIGVWGSAFIGLWRLKRQPRHPRTMEDLRRQLGLAANQNPSPEQIAAAGLGIVTRPPAPKAPPTPPTVEYVGRRRPPSVYCQHCLAELELAERFERESG